MAFSVRLVRRVHFSCGHRYYQPQLSPDENRKLYGSLYSEHGWGHNFILEAHLEGPINPVTGMLANLRDIDVWLKQVTDPLDHHFLNEDVAVFRDLVPTAENIARYCYDQLNSLVKPPAQLFKVRLYEGEDLWVDYSDREDLEE